MAAEWLIGDPLGLDGDMDRSVLVDVPFKLGLPPSMSSRQLLIRSVACCSCTPFGPPGPLGPFGPMLIELRLECMRLPALVLVMMLLLRPTPASRPETWSPIPKVLADVSSRHNLAETP